MDFTKGFPELINKLKSLKKTKAKACIRKGTRAGAKILQAQAKRNAPTLTGQLKTQIKVRAITRSRIWTGTRVRLDIYYASITELGGIKTPAQHFMLRASKSVGQQALNLCLDIIQMEISKL